MSLKISKQLRRGEIRRSLVPASALLWAGLALVTPGPLSAATESGGPEFKVLDAATSSGSRSREAARPPVQFEVLGAATGSGMGLKGQEEIVPAVAPAEPEVVLEAASGGGQLVLIAQNKASSGQAESPAEEARAAIFASLDQWHRQTQAAYRYDIGSLQDPFLPIQEVRGERPESLGGIEDLNKPPLLRLDLSQLKLVAITTLSDRPGGSLASFEDGAGSSYILRQSDLIGRHNGRITQIEPTQVTVEERPRGATAPLTTVIKLNVLSDTSGLTRESGSDDQPTGIQN